jgi:hypothetical protein
LINAGVALAEAVAAKGIVMRPLKVEDGVVGEAEAVAGRKGETVTVVVA